MTVRGPASRWVRPGLAAAVAVLCLPAAALLGQSVAVHAVEGTSGKAVAGAIIKLIDSSGAVVRQGLTDEAGRLVLRASGLGRYRLRGDRIGFAGVDAAAIELRSAGRVVVELTFPDEPVVLTELEVKSSSDCRSDAASAPGAAVLWSEIKKALDATAIAKESGLSFELALWRRELSPDLEVRFEEVDTILTTSPRPFLAVDPAYLATNGYVQAREDKVVGDLYYGPDERVLLSPGFLATHCFHLNSRTVDGRKQVGLRFELIRGRRVPDIAGTMWVDAERRALTEVSFRYQNVAESRIGGTATGRLEFAVLPEGWWVVSRWNIRVPLLHEIRVIGKVVEDFSGVRRIVGGYGDNGGAVVSVRSRVRGL